MFFLEDYFRLIPRVIRWNVFPVFALFLVVFTYVFLADLRKRFNFIFQGIHDVALVEIRKGRGVKIAPVVSKSETKKLAERHVKLQKSEEKRLKKASASF